MQRLDPLRNDATNASVHVFASQWPTPVLLLRYVVDGDLQEHGRGPEGTMRHSIRRTLAARLEIRETGRRRAVRTERVAVVRHSREVAIRAAYSIGRDKRCDVVLNDYTISAEHARLHYLPQLARWMVEDLASTNRSYLNGTELPANERGLVTSLDEIRLGRMVFLYLEPSDFYAYLRGDY